MREEKGGRHAEGKAIERLEQKLDVGNDGARTAKDCQQLSKARREVETDSPQSPQKEPRLPTPGFETSGHQNCERVHLSCFKAPSS